MKPSLADWLRIVLPALAPALAAPDVRQTLLAAAQALPPIALGGLECRLGSDGQQVDLLQCIALNEGAPDLLLAHLQAAPSVFQNEWVRIRDFCIVWADPSSTLYASMHNIWLEFDLDSRAHSGLPVPSVFLALNPKVPKPDAHAAVRAALPILAGQALPGPLLESLDACFQACPETALLSHVGAMLPRALQGWRVNVQGLDQPTMVAFLQRVGWHWPTNELETLLADLFALVDHVTLNLDVGAQIFPRLGLECGFKEQPDYEPRWSGFLDWLVARGLVTAPRGAALLDWAGTDLPSAQPAWPENSIVASLARAPDEFALLGRRVSHVKIVYWPGQPLEAKGYIGFGHLWSKADAFKSRLATPARTHARRENTFETAMAQAIEFLLGSRNASGWWEDFKLPAGPSDEWVTAYVGTALARQPGNQAQAAARAAWSVLGRRRDEGAGWGYCASTPVDGDSTGWALQLARLIGEAESLRACGARRCLEGHLRPDGGIATYSTDGPIRLWMDMPAEAPFDGWLVSHPCVTAAVAAVEGFAEGTSDYLRRTQLGDGSWRAYWWCDHEYATALAAEALAAGAAAQDRARIARAVQWALGRLTAEGSVASARHPAGSPFATAWCLRMLRLGDDTTSAGEAADRAARWLLDHQRPDGAWTGCAQLRVPPPGVLDPDSDSRGTLVSLDGQSNFTTATVLMALSIAGSP